MKRFFYLTTIFILTIILNLSSQNLERPKLVVGIVIDQMRFTDLYRYYDLYTDKGFKRLINEGTNFTYAHFNYIPTNTGPGHASIYTGTTPYYHGIINNEFYDRNLKKTVNCVYDENHKSVGSNDSEGKKSPKNLLVTTITDALKLFTNKKSKVISLSIKDRGAILPGGHLADGAFWYNKKTGDFITSTYYMKELPNWVKEFNNKKLGLKYLAEEWNLLIDKKYYVINNPDESPFEDDLFKEGKNSFPHSFKNLNSEEKLELLTYTPFIHDMLVELAKSAIISESLGKNSVPDFLTISFSATDMIGHAWGNYSYELLDTYLRLDLQLANFLEFLDNEIGKGNYLLFLTSDHGAVETPGYLKQNRIPTGGLPSAKILDSLKAFCIRTFNSDKIIKHYSSGMIYLDNDFIVRNNLSYIEIEEKISHYLRSNFAEIQTIARRSELENRIAARNEENLIINGWHPYLSADIIFNLRPGYLFKFLEQGTTHGSQYTYDTHIPLIFYGWKIPAQTISNKVFIVDVAPTVSNLLRTTAPNACIGIPLLK